MKGLGLLTLKPLIYAANVSEDDLGNHGANNTHVQVGRTWLGDQSPVITAACTGCECGSLPCRRWQRHSSICRVSLWL